MLLLTLAVSVGVSMTLVVLLFGCACWIKKQGFRDFDDSFDSEAPSPQPSPNLGLSVTFEPLPDILPKSASCEPSKPALRPRVSCLNKQKHEQIAKLLAIRDPFPRDQLLYIHEIGSGWFGHVLHGDADQIIVGSRRSQVVIKVLKDDAIALEQQQFVQEVAPFRELDHPNVLKLLGHCTETSPYLVILEYFPLGDLKSYLQHNPQDPARTMLEFTMVLKFAMDMAAGLACLHRHNYVHHDFAARNCLVTSELGVKVGDYGVSEDMYRGDYFDSGRDLIPIRWMAPELLMLQSGVWQTVEFTYKANIWAFGIALWEILEMGRQPYPDLSDQETLDQVFKERVTKPALPNVQLENKECLFEVMKFCWLSADYRPTIEDVHNILKQLLATKEQDDFEVRWHRLIPKEARVHRPEPVSRRVEVILHESEHRDINESEVSSGTGSITDPLEAHADMMPINEKTPSKSHTYQMTSTPLNHSGQTESFASAKTEVGNSRYVTAKSFPSNFEQNDSSIDETMFSDLDSGSKGTKDSAYSDTSNVNNTSTTPLFGDVPLVAVDTGIHSDSSSTKADEDKSLLLNRITEVESQSILNNDANTVSIATKNELIGNINDAVTTDPNDDVVILSNGNEPPDNISLYDSFHSARRFPNRSLITIPEDEMVSDNSLRESYSGVSTPFEIIFDESHMHDTFEWDYDIGEELVGRVKESENSVPQMSDLTDWTFEVGGSSQGSTSSRSACDDDAASLDSQHSSLAGEADPPIAQKSGSVDIQDFSIISDGTNALSSSNLLSVSQLSSVFDSAEESAQKKSVSFTSGDQLEVVHSYKQQLQATPPEFNPANQRSDRNPSNDSSEEGAKVINDPTPNPAVQLYPATNNSDVDALL